MKRDPKKIILLSILAVAALYFIFGRKKERNLNDNIFRQQEEEKNIFI